MISATHPSFARRFLELPGHTAEQKAPNELHVALGRGRGLVIKDKNTFSKGGSSDPRVQFTIPGSDAKATSTVKRKTLTPCWNEEFVFPLTAGEVNNQPTLAVLCEDYDDLSAADSMGVFEVDLRALGASRKTERKWHDLKVDPKRPKDKVSGAIELWIRWVHNEALAFEPYFNPASETF